MSLSSLESTINRYKKLFSDEYQIINYNNNGVYGLIFQVKDLQSGEIRALKFFKPDGVKNRIMDGLNYCAVREIATLQKLKSIPNIPGILDYKIKSLNREFYVDMPYIPITISSHNMLSEDKRIEVISEYFPKILTTLAHLHHQKIYHNDIKMDNILIDKDKGSCYLIDFGLSSRTSLIHNENDICHPVNFRPPEILYSTKYHNDKSDIWALAMSTICFIFGDVFANFKDIFSRIPSMKKELHTNALLLSKEKEIIFKLEYMNNAKILNKIPEVLRRILESMTNINPNKRLSAKQILKKYYKTDVIFSELIEKSNMTPEQESENRTFISDNIETYIKKSVTDKLKEKVIEKAIPLYQRVKDLNLFDDETNLRITLYIIHLLYDVIFDLSKVSKTIQFNKNIMTIIEKLDYNLY